MSVPRWPLTQAMSIARAEVGEAWAVANAIRRYARRVAALGESSEAWPATADFETPVALVHGAAHNGSAWSALQERLEAAGFTRLVALEYRLGASLGDLAADLGARVEKVIARAGTDRIHVVGHSLGGFALRAWHDLGGGSAVVRSAVSLGSPQQGYAFGRFPPLPGLPAPLRELRSGSALRRRLAAGPADHSRWTTIAGGNDHLVRPRDVALDGADNVVLPGHGHIGLLHSRLAAGHVCFALLAAEEAAAAGQAA